MAWVGSIKLVISGQEMKLTVSGVTIQTFNGYSDVFVYYSLCFNYRGLVPLHNACSYGHFEVTEMLIKHGANVNAMDLWQFTPLHEAASKSRVEVCSLLLSEGADPTLLNCHSKSAIDVAPTRELQERLACELSIELHCVFVWICRHVDRMKRYGNAVKHQFYVPTFCVFPSFAHSCMVLAKCP